MMCCRKVVFVSYEIFRERSCYQQNDVDVLLGGLATQQGPLGKGQVEEQGGLNIREDAESNHMSVLTRTVAALHWV